MFFISLTTRMNLIYLTLVLHGIGVLMPWNMIITAKEHKSGDWIYMLTEVIKRKIFDRLVASVLNRGPFSTSLFSSDGFFKLDLLSGCFNLKIHCLQNTLFSVLRRI